MDLNVTLAGKRELVLKNPVIAASGTFGSGLEYRQFGDLATLGGIAVKGISLQPRAGNKEPRIAETPAGMLNAIGLQNDGIDAFLRRTLPALPWRHTAIIANIYAASIEEFGELAARFNEVEEIAALEVNVSCPNVAAGGALFGSSPDLCAAVTCAVVRNAPSKHVIVKLSPNVTDIAAIAKSAEDAGADSLACINTLAGMAINARTRRPMLGNIIGGLSGPAIKPVALRCVWQASRAVKIPVIGIGGIVSAWDIIEFLLAGASAVEVGTASFMRPDACFSLVKALPDALAACGSDSVAALTGALILD
ncbi:MAG: dihydroorotate dehydrogenase [Desulfovibrio sp.]|nr:dihydroorotate dehydrogenase [Desulfovibrio sp.]